MKNPQPLIDPTTHYRIEVQGRINVDWLQGLDGSVEIIPDDLRQTEDITVLNMHTDQSGIVGLLRSLHGLGMTILKLQIVTQEESGG